VYIYTYIQIHRYTYIHTYVCFYFTGTCIYFAVAMKDGTLQGRINACRCVYVNIHIFNVYTYKYIYIYKYMYIYIHICIQIHRYTYIYTNVSFCSLLVCLPSDIQHRKGSGHTSESLEYIRICIFTYIHTYKYTSIYTYTYSFAKEPYKRDDILQKRPIVLRSLLIVATPYVWLHAVFWHVYRRT